MPLRWPAIDFIRSRPIETGQAWLFGFDATVRHDETGRALEMLAIVLTLLVGLSLGFGVAWPLARRPSQAPTTPAWESFLREFERARRYERPFVIAVVPDAASMSGLRAADDRERLTGLQLRRTDETWWVGSDLYILLPETDGARGHRWRRRVLAAGACEQVRLAGFPDDGVTTNALLGAVDAPTSDGPLDIPPPTQSNSSRIS